MRNFNRILILIIAAASVVCSCEKGDKGDTQPEKSYIRLSFSQKLVNNNPGTFELFIDSNTSYTIEPQVSWLSASVKEGNGCRNITITYEGNYIGETQAVGEERSGTIRFAAKGTIPTKLTVTQGARTFRNPIFMPLPDPYIWRNDDAEGVFYYVCKANGNSINLGRSNKLTEPGGTSAVWSLPTSTVAWNKRDLWAPELFRINDRNGDYWYVYYAAGNPELAGLQPGSYGTQRTGVIRCKGNLDPFVKANWEDMGMVYTGNNYEPGITATVDNTIYAIDMTTFELKGQRYAVWSGNVSATNGEQRLYIATMENPWTINSSRVEISRAELSWEKMKSERINEGPAVLVNETAGKIFIVYSANGSWKKEYCLGWICLDMDDDPMIKSNWTKSANYAFWRVDNVMETDNPNYDDPKNLNTMSIGGIHGVGHNCFTKSPDGTEDWIVYHSKRYKDDGWDNRNCFIQRFKWNPDGTPNFGTPVGWQEDLQVPSGEPL